MAGFAPFFRGDARAFQSVLDLVEVDGFFPLGCAAERDDADFILTFGVDDRYDDPGKKTQSHEALLIVGEPVVLESKGDAGEDLPRVYEVKAMGLDVRGPLPFGP